MPYAIWPQLPIKLVVRENIVKEPNDQENYPALVADLSVRSVWHPRVVDSGAKYYVHCDVGAVNLSSTKKQKYSQAAEIIKCIFYAICCDS